MTTTLPALKILGGTRRMRRVRKFKTAPRRPRVTPTKPTYLPPRNAPLHIFEVNGEYWEKGPLDVVPRRHEYDHDHYLDWLRARRSA